MFLAVNAAAWWGPFGWLYREVPGNLAASGIAFVAGLAVGARALRKVHAKLDAEHRRARERHAELLASHRALRDDFDRVAGAPSAGG